MTKFPFPTFGEFLSYLRSLGFTTDERYEYGVICRHAESGCRLSYQDRKLTDPMLYMNLASAHHHLTGRGIIDDVSLLDFLATFVPEKTG
ncbi:hypothetical protein [Limnoglobus roseus]|nr:hypothetical protein [Limnoglobus roseus]